MTATIIDNDGTPPPVTFSIAPQSVTVNENAGTVSFTVTRSDGSTAQTVYASTVQNQGATNAGDYTGLTDQAVAFAVEELSQTVTVAITNDTLAEGDETFGLIVQAAPSDPIDTFLATATFKIQANDSTPPPVTFSIAPQSVTVNENAGTVSFTVTRSDGSTAQTVYASTVQNQGATNAGDYTGLADQAVAFAVGELSQTVTVAITNDTLAEGDETFGLIVQAAPSDPIDTFLATATFKIQANDSTPPPVTFSIAPQSVTVNESAGTVSFTVSRSDGSTAQTVYASTVQNQGATNAGDYTGLTDQAVAFAVGELSQTVTVAITNDALAEGDETFGLIVQAAPSDPIDTFLATATFKIQANDSTPLPVTFSIVPQSVTVNESAGTVSFTVTRSDGSTAQTVYASTVQNQGATNAGDYTGLTDQAVAFAVGEMSQTVTVAITNDTTVESSETFGLILQANASDPVGTFLASSTFTIVDNDGLSITPPAAA